MILGALFINEPITTMAAIGAALSIGGVVGVTFVQTGLAPNPDLQPG